MKKFSQLLKIEYVFTKKEPGTFSMGVGMPIVFFLLMSTVIDVPDNIRGMVVRNMMLSMTAMSCISFTFFSLPISILEDQKNGWYNTIKRTPIAIWQYYLARLCRIVCSFILSIILVFLVGYFVKDVRLSWDQWLVSAVCLLLGSTAFLSMGFILSHVSTVDKLSVLSNIVYLGSCILGGLWWPVSTFPDWLQKIAEVMPTYHLLKLATQYVTDGTFASFSFVILLGYAMLGIVCSSLLHQYKKTRG